MLQKHDMFWKCVLRPFVKGLSIKSRPNQQVRAWGWDWWEIWGSTWFHGRMIEINKVVRMCGSETVSQLEWEHLCKYFGMYFARYLQPSCLVVSVAFWKPGWKFHHFVVNPGDIKGSQGEDEGDREWKERMGRSWAQNVAGHSFPSWSCLSWGSKPRKTGPPAWARIIGPWLSDRGRWKGGVVLEWEWCLLGLFVCLFVCLCWDATKKRRRDSSASLHHSKTSF